MPAGWEWRAGTAPHPTLSALSAQRPHLGRRARHRAAASTLEVPEPRSSARAGWALVLRNLCTLPFFPPFGILGAVNSSPGIPGQEFCVLALASVKGERCRMPLRPTDPD